jgi:hypothetical protein
MNRERRKPSEWFARPDGSKGARRHVAALNARTWPHIPDPHSEFKMGITIWAHFAEGSDEHRALADGNEITANAAIFNRGNDSQICRRASGD